MKYFKNVESFKNLKEQYKKLIKVNHPDAGGNNETMQEINSEYDILFAIWKDKAIKANNISEEEKTETAQSTRRSFYTANGWEGSRYDSNLSLKEIAKIVRGYVKEKYPLCKFSIRTHYASMCQSLSVDFLEFNGQMFMTGEELKQIYYTPFTYTDKDGIEKTSDYISDIIQDLLRKYRNNGIFTKDSWTQQEFLDCYDKTVFEDKRSFFALPSEHFQAVIDDVQAFINSYNYSDCDGMIDYFDVNFYDGKVDISACKEVHKVERIKNETKTPTTTESKKESAQIEKGEKPYTIEESKHTKTNETIYLVKWLPTLSRSEYIELNNKIKSIGGYYSKFTHSFIFKSNPENELAKIA